MCARNSLAPVFDLQFADDVVYMVLDAMRRDAQRLANFPGGKVLRQRSQYVPLTWGQGFNQVELSLAAACAAGSWRQHGAANGASTA